MRVHIFTALFFLETQIGARQCLAQSLPGIPAEEDRSAVARALFAQGRVAYDLGNYDEAIVKFRGAYEQVQEPAFLFNIAQAYRLKSDCPRAIDAYRHFLRLSKDSDNREAAETHLADLRAKCSATEPPVSAIELSPKPSAPPSPPLAGTIRLQEPSAPAETDTNTKFVYGALITGGTLAALAVGLGAWNLHRYNDWSAENDFLANPPAGNDTSELVERQAANDDRLSSIRTGEKISWGLAAGAAVFLATGVIWKLVAQK